MRAVTVAGGGVRLVELVVTLTAVAAPSQLMLKKWLWMYSVVEEPLPMVMQKMVVRWRSRSVATVQVKWVVVLVRFAVRKGGCGFSHDAFLIFQYANENEPRTGNRAQIPQIMTTVQQ